MTMISAPVSTNALASSLLSTPPPAIIGICNTCEQTFI